MPPSGREHKDFIAYYRVSTAKQAASGLGLEAQRSAVEAYAQAEHSRIIREYQETESGKRDDRPELLKAIAHAKRSGLRLVIAKQDRLGRKAAFVLRLLDETKVDFVAADDPHPSALSTGMRAVFAQEEAERISIRTRDALAAYKASGKISKRIKLLYPEGVPPEVVEATAGKLGASLPQCRNLTPEGRDRGRALSREARRDGAVEAYIDLSEHMIELRSQGGTLRGIAGRLNADGHTTRRGRPWNPTQVKRVLDRAGPPPSQPKSNT